MKSNNTFLGTAAMTTASALRVAVQIVTLPIIGRILGPSAYGQIALVSPFILFAMLLAESGLGACIVRADKLSRDLEGTVFCFSALFSIIIIVLFAIFSYPLGQLLGEPTFPYLLMGMSSILLLASCNIVPAALLLRAKRYQWIAVSDVASCLGGIAAVTFGILMGWGVWSLVAQQVAFWICKLVVVLFASHWVPYITFHVELIKQNLKFGSNLTGATVLAFITRNIDNVIVGAILGSQQLGYYAIAYQIVQLPQMILSGSVYYTLFSKISEAQRTGKSSPDQFLKTLRGVLLIVMPAMVGLAVTAPLSVPLILGDEWTPSILLMILLTPLGICQALNAVMGGVLVGLGRGRKILMLGVVNSSVAILAIVIGANINVNAVALGVSVAAVVYSTLSLRAVAKEYDLSYRIALQTVIAPVASSILMGFAVLPFSYYISADTPLLLRLIICVVVGVSSYLLVLINLFHDEMKADLETIKMAFFKTREKQS